MQPTILRCATYCGCTTRSRQANNQKLATVRKAKNGKYWTSDFWSDKHIIEDEEYREIDKWFYDHLFFEDQHKLQLSIFESELILFKKELNGERLVDFLLYSEDKNFNVRPERLDNIIREALESNNYPLDAYWFTAFKSNTYKHDVGMIGVYTFKRNNDEERNGGLYPVFSNLIDEKGGQSIRDNYGLFSGLIGINKDWILLISLLNEEQKGISIKVGGNKRFCSLIREKVKENHKPAENTG